MGRSNLIPSMFNKNEYPWNEKMSTGNEPFRIFDVEELKEFPIGTKFRHEALGNGTVEILHD